MLFWEHGGWQWWRSTSPWGEQSKIHLTETGFQENKTIDPVWNLPGGCSTIEVNSENHVWNGQNGAIKRSLIPHSLTLQRTAGINLTGGNAYCLRSGQRWVKVSILSGTYSKNQRGHGIKSCDAKRCTSALPKGFQTWATAWRQNPFPWHELHSRQKVRCEVQSTQYINCSKLKETMPWAQRRWRTCLFRVCDHEPPWWFMWDPTAIWAFTVKWRRT